MVSGIDRYGLQRSFPRQTLYADFQCIRALRLPSLSPIAPVALSKRPRSSNAPAQDTREKVRFSAPLNSMGAGTSVPLAGDLVAAFLWSTEIPLRNTNGRIGPPRDRVDFALIH